ncbi:MAG: DUF4214 domain-containing protein [Pseudobdellovibrionaceae bacterium]
MKRFFNVQTFVGVVLFSAIVLVYQNCAPKGGPGGSSGSSSLAGSSIIENGADESGANLNTNEVQNTGICVGNDLLPSALINEPITDQPAFSSSYAIASRTNMEAYNIKSTSISMQLTSQCLDTSVLTREPVCKQCNPDEENCDVQCVSKKTLMVSVTLKCDSTSDTATHCSELHEGDVLDLSVAADLQKATVVVMSNQDTCAQDKSDTNMPPFTGGASGKVKITKLSKVEDGTLVAVDLQNVKLDRGTTGAKLGPESLTVNGAFETKIISIPTCAANSSGAGSSSDGTGSGGSGSGTSSDGSGSGSGSGGSGSGGSGSGGSGSEGSGSGSGSGSDGTGSQTTESAAVKAARTAYLTEMYQKAFSRAPDNAGMDYWMSTLSGATNVEACSVVMRTFANSDEFKNFNYSNNDFLTRLYDLAFARAPDSPGLNYWLAELNNSTMTRAAVADSFAVSEEFTTSCKARLPSN